MKLLIVAALFMMLTGLPMATALISSGPLALAAAPTCSGLVCALAGMACLATGTPFRPWVVLFTLVTWVAAAIVTARRWSDWRRGQSEWRRDQQLRGSPPSFRPRLASSRLIGWLPAGLVSLITLPMLTGATSPPVDWDARAIWWFHGLWFLQGGEATAKAMGNPAFGWSHPSYPPLYPTASAALWSFYDPMDRMLAKALGSELTFGAVLLIGCLLVVLAPHRLRWPVAVLGGLVGVGIFGIGHGHGTAGHLDVLWAASFGAAALALLVAPVQRDLIVLGALSAAAAALTKSEGVPAVLLLVVLFVIRHRRQWRRASAMLAVLAPAAVWMAEGIHFDRNPNDAFSISGLAGLLLGDPKYTDRVPPVLSEMWKQVGLTVVAALAITLVALLGLGRQRRRQGIDSWLWLPLTALGTTAAFLLIYATGPYEVHWWLMTSIDRTMIVVRLLIVVELAVWLIVGLTAWLIPPAVRRRRPPDGAVPEGDEADHTGDARAPATALVQGAVEHRSRSTPITSRLLRPY